MFKIFALATLLVAGQPSGEPHKFTSKLSYPTMEACEAARTNPDPDGAGEAALKANLLARGMEATVTSECRKVDAE